MVGLESVPRLLSGGSIIVWSLPRAWRSGHRAFCFGFWKLRANVFSADFNLFLLQGLGLGQCLLWPRVQLPNQRLL